MEAQSEPYTYSMVIDGELVRTAETMDVVNPATGKVFAQVPVAGDVELDRAVAAATRAFPSWRDTPAVERKRAVLAAADTIEANAPELTRLFTQEMGRPLAGAAFEFVRAVGWTRGMSDWTLEPEVSEEDDIRRIEIHPVPLGVVAGLIPWNFPVMIAIIKMVPAVLTGNTVVLKPSPFTPLSTLRVMELIHGHFPPGVINILSGSDDLGPKMTAHPGFAKITFTGSTATGKRIAASAAEDLKRVTLELGGNDAAIVLPDADVDAVAEKVFLGAFGNTGQICVATKRLYVHDTIYDRFRDKLHALAKAAKVDDGLKQGTSFGPLQNARQHVRVLELMDDARQQGLTLLTGSDVPEQGYFVPLTIVDNPPEDARVVQEEAFGPLLPMMRYSDLDEVIDRANDTTYGLGGAVWSSDPKAAIAVAHRLDTGNVWVNSNTGVSPLTSIGGAKHSGIGVESGLAGLREYTRPKAIWIAK